VRTDFIFHKNGLPPLIGKPFVRYILKVSGTMYLKFKPISTSVSTNIAEEIENEKSGEQ
jgi:hypothetical protein